MKTDLVEVSETQKHLVVEIPSGVVDAEIERVTKDYSRAARIPGFRPGKVPVQLIKQRFRDQILHDVAHGLIPRAVDEALRERGVEPIDTPDIRDVLVQEGQPLKFTASFETVPPIEPGDYSSVTVKRPRVTVEDGEVAQTLERLRQHHARYDPVDDRRVELGDTVILDLRRSPVGKTSAPDLHQDIAVDIGAPANPPGFDEQLLGLELSTEKSFEILYPGDYMVSDLAGRRVQYDVKVKAIRRRVVPELDDDLAKDAGDFENLDALTQHVRNELTASAQRAADREMRTELVKQLADRVSFEVPESLIERELDRRVEEFVRRLLEQRVDPAQAEVDWNAFREGQRSNALEAVRGALVLDEVARREQLQVTPEEVETEVEQYAARVGRAAAAVRARLEKEGGLARLHAGLRRERAVDFLLSRATITDE